MKQLPITSTPILSTIALIATSLTWTISSAEAQEYQGCFMINGYGRVVNLSGVCMDNSGTPTLPNERSLVGIPGNDIERASVAQVGDTTCPPEYEEDDRVYRGSLSTKWNYEIWQDSSRWFYAKYWRQHETCDQARTTSSYPTQDDARKAMSVGT